MSLFQRLFHNHQTSPRVMDQPLRIVIAKPGLDGHDRGAKVVARALRDAGHEVIYTGLRRTPEQIIETVRDEDAILLGLSSLSGAHGHLFPRICETLREHDMGDVIVFGGGIIPEDDRPPLFGQVFVQSLAQVQPLKRWSSSLLLRFNEMMQVLDTVQDGIGIRLNEVRFWTTGWVPQKQVTGVHSARLLHRLKTANFDLMSPW